MTAPVDHGHDREEDRSESDIAEVRLNEQALGIGRAAHRRLSADIHPKPMPASARNTTITAKSAEIAVATLAMPAMTSAGHPPSGEPT